MKSGSHHRPTWFIFLMCFVDVAKMEEQGKVNYALYVGNGRTWSKSECCYLLAGFNPYYGSYTLEQMKAFANIDCLMEHGKKLDANDPCLKNRKVTEPFYQYAILERFDPLAVIQWALATGLIDVPKPLADWCKARLEIPLDNKSTKQKITANELAKLFDNPAPTLGEVAAHYFKITNKAEANRKYKDGKLFRVFKPEGGTQKTPYLVDLDSLATYLNKGK